MTADVGAAAPDFDLESDAGTSMRLGDFEGEWLVLYFYPRDSTPGCTREAQDFTQAAARLRKLGARVAGVSRDSVKSHGSFRDKFALGFPLLSDPDLVAHKSYGAWGKKVMYGKHIEGALRSTFLIAPNGRVAHVWRSVRVDGHADAVVAALVAATTTAKSAPEAKGTGTATPARTSAAAKRAPGKSGPATNAKAPRTKTTTKAKAPSTTKTTTRAKALKRARRT
jgi:thioredoxin-dependent peroxiredoxin